MIKGVMSGAICLATCGWAVYALNTIAFINFDRIEGGRSVFIVAMSLGIVVLISASAAVTLLGVTHWPRWTGLALLGGGAATLITVFPLRLLTPGFEARAIDGVVSPHLLFDRWMLGGGMSAALLTLGALLWASSFLIKPAEDEA